MGNVLWKAARVMDGGRKMTNLFDACLFRSLLLLLAMRGWKQKQHKTQCGSRRGASKNKACAISQFRRCLLFLLLLSLALFFGCAPEHCVIQLSCYATLRPICHTWIFTSPIKRAPTELNWPRVLFCDLLQNNKFHASLIGHFAGVENVGNKFLFASYSTLYTLDSTDRRLSEAWLLPALISQWFEILMSCISYKCELWTWHKEKGNVPFTRCYILGLLWPDWGIVYLRLCIRRCQ